MQDHTTVSYSGNQTRIDRNRIRASWLMGKEEREEEKSRKRGKRSEMNCHYSGSFY